MLTKYLLLSLATLLAVSCHQPVDNLTPCNPDMPQFSQRIKKVVRHVTYPGTGFPEAAFTTEYFYDALGRVDSMVGQKVLYAANGRVEKILQYDYYNTYISGEYTYYHDSQGRVESIARQYFDDSGQPTQQSQQFIKYDDNGLVQEEWSSSGNDKSVVTLENCNAVKVQRFYNDTGEEHYLSIASFDEKWNPEYVAGLNNIHPGEHSPNNRTFGQLVHWDCGDYDPSPITYSITYNKEGLPLKSEADAGYVWTEYIYE